MIAGADFHFSVPAISIILIILYKKAKAPRARAHVELILAML
jgi:hypothetical protein